MANENNTIDDRSQINVTLYKKQWDIVIEWMSKFPYSEAVNIINAIADDIKGNTEAEQDDFIVIKLSIYQFDTILYSLGLGPYYLMSDIINEIYNQGSVEVQKLRDQLSEQKIVDDLNSNEELKPRSTTKTKRAKKNVNYHDA